MPAHRPHESIEGERISGSSRYPLRYMRDELRNGKKRCLYIAELNVSAKIKEPLMPGTPLLYTEDPLPLTGAGETIGCYMALITSTEKRGKYKEDVASNVTATHGANIWEFRKQTNVKVVTPRQEIINAMRKRISGIAGPILITP